MLRPISQGLMPEVASWYMRAFFRSIKAAAISVMPRQTMSTGMTSRHFFAFEGSWRKFVPSKYEIEFASRNAGFVGTTTESLAAEGAGKFGTFGAVFDVLHGFTQRSDFAL